MANKKSNNKGLIIGICSAVVVVVIIIVAVLVATNANKLNDSYFVSDGSKYVLTLESDEALIAEDDSQPVKTHIVYTYSGDEITGAKTYEEYKDAASAQKAYDAYKEAGEDMSNVAVDGKYLIITATPDQYEGVTATDVKQQIEFIESLKNLNLDESTEDTGEVVESTEAVEVDENAE